MSEVNDDLKQTLSELNISYEDYIEREKEYLLTLKRSVLNNRKIVLKHIKNTFGVQTTQKNLRLISWNFTQHIQSNTEGYAMITSQFKDILPLPLKIASSHQEVYHQTHLINAYLYSLIMPQAHLNMYITSQSIINYVSIEEDDIIRLENQNTIYLHFISLKPELFSVKASKAPSAPTKVTLNELNVKLDLILDLLNKGVAPK